ncbi:hypothetical protein FNO01nite_09270 [Flavobacterium noncentrifugens]|uniref:Hemoglobin n=1 Tax=Flavobacterium noncentrifugens TaxID=1128970 RepID=A0A1G8UZD9_9FLAO|nr:group III truncated hemoglobin [Flavobacterium noncentrifugens]GEP50255.1 hypothetical protein FNO01nite_09270 [Flavobacterium noncentrifugens]SDJ58465.1 hemoglobin [Flavobacterium noncentrifugens]
MKDIQNRNDIDLLMRDFYGRLLNDPAISYVFTDVAKIDLEHHLPTIGDFWEQNLLHTGNYKNNVLQIHQQLHQKEKLSPELFEIWLDHFYIAIDANFGGKNSEKAKTRALSIATIMKIKMQ